MERRECQSVIAVTILITATLVACTKGNVAVKDPVVVLESGSIRGTTTETHLGRTIAAFRGIPYAKPPVGRHRFKESVPMGPWIGIYNATTEPNECLQYDHLGYHITGSEDCLYLSVFTPRVPSGAAASVRSTNLLDVIVYIHGGAFMFHSSVEYSPKFLLDRDVVLVTLNYRLGPLGFLSTGDEVVPGNMGLKDQNLALKWVQRNIAAFGGDSKKVTIAGMSAGGASVHYHMLSPMSAGLFNKAISISGTSLNPWAFAENMPEKTQDLAASVGCSFLDSHLLIKCLRSRPAEQIVSYSKHQQSWHYSPISPWAPIVEPAASLNPFLTAKPIDIIMAGQAQDVPWLNTLTSHEGLYPFAEFVFDDKKRAELEQRWFELIPDLLEFNLVVPQNKMREVSQAIKDKFLGSIPASDSKAILPLVKMASERIFNVGIVEAGAAHALLYTSPVYMYNFSYIGENTAVNMLCDCDVKFEEGASHADDASYVMENPVPNPLSPKDKEIVRKMVNLWADFAATGTVKWEGVASWPEVQSSYPILKSLDISTSGDATIGKLETDFAFWKSVGLVDDSFPDTFWQDISMGNTLKEEL